MLWLYALIQLAAEWDIFWNTSEGELHIHITYHFVYAVLISVRRSWPFSNQLYLKNGFLVSLPLAGINPAPWFHRGMTVSRTWAVLHAKKYSCQGRTAVLWLALVLESVTSLECQKEADESKYWILHILGSCFLLNLSSSLVYSGILLIWDISVNRNILDIVFLLSETHFFCFKNASHILTIQLLCFKHQSTEKISI